MSELLNYLNDADPILMMDILINICAEQNESLSQADKKQVKKLHHLLASIAHHREDQLSLHSKATAA